MIYLEMFQIEESSDPEPGPIIINKGIKFRLHSVKCNDETNGEWESDEISMAAVFMDPTGASSVYNEFSVDNDFDSREQKNYHPKIMKTFNMPIDNFPQSYSAVFSLTEKDNGGMSNFIQELYNSIKEVPL